MSNTDKKDLSGTDICKIIKQCQLSGVRSIKVGQVEISFGDAPVVINTSQDLSVPPLSANAENVNKDIIDEATEAQLMIDDPAAFEKLQVSRDMERDRRTQ